MKTVEQPSLPIQESFSEYIQKLGQNSHVFSNTVQESPIQNNQQSAPIQKAYFIPKSMKTVEQPILIQKPFSEFLQDLKQNPPVFSYTVQNSSESIQNAFQNQ